MADELVAQAHIENAAIKLFNWADCEDRAGRYNKYENSISLVDLKYFNCFIFIYSRNVVKAFYSAGMLLDVCAVFGELNEDVAQQKKYSLY